LLQSTYASIDEAELTPPEPLEDMKWDYLRLQKRDFSPVVDHKDGKKMIHPAGKMQGDWTLSPNNPYSKAVKVEFRH
jgi:hypothetical protein